MKKMKGFWRIIEIIIILIIMFLLLVQFSYIPKSEYRWMRNKLSLQGRDAMYVLEKNGTNWFNATEVEKKLDLLFNKTGIRYNLHIKHTMKSNIWVACYCNNDEYFITESALRDFYINGRWINFSLVQMGAPANPSDIVFNNYYDVTLIWNYSLAGKSDEMLSYLNSGKGIVLIRDLRASDIIVNERDELEGVMGITWNDSLSNPGNKLVFSLIHIENPAYQIYNYFYHFPNSSGERYPNPHEFSDFINENGWYEKVVPKNTNTTTSVLDNEHGASGLIAGTQWGRTVWLSNSTNTDDWRVLMKAAVVWAAGDTDYIINNDISREIVTVSFMKLLRKDMYEPIDIVLTMGYLY